MADRIAFVSRGSRPLPRRRRLLRRSLAVVLVPALAVVHGAALACGTWDGQDRQLHANVGFYIENIVVKPARKPAEYIYLKAESLPAMHAEDTHGRTMISFSTPPEQLKGELRLYRGKGGTYDGDRLRLRNGRAFVIAVTKNPEYRDKHDLPIKWIADVKEGDQTVLHAVAMAMCFQQAGEYDSPERDERERIEIRRRLMIYLAWRELARGAPASPPRPSP